MIIDKIKRYIRNNYIYKSIRNYKNIPGWLTEEQAFLIHDLIKTHSKPYINSGYLCVEIGSWMGKSTYILAKSTGDNTNIFAVDPFDGSGDEFFQNNYKSSIDKMDNDLLTEFKRNMEKYGINQKVTPVVGLSEEVAHQVPEQIDALFIDGNHEYESVKKDFDNYTAKLKQNGLLLFHDVDFNPFEVKMDTLKNKNDFGAIYGPTRVIKECIVHSDSWRDLNHKCGMFYCYKN